MKDICKEAKNYNWIIKDNEDEDNQQKCEYFEKMLEDTAVLVFTIDQDREIFRTVGVQKCGKLAVGSISRVINEYLIEQKMNKLRLLNLQEITNDIFENISHYPSVQKVLENSYNEAPFIVGLSYYIARHIIIRRYQLGLLKTPDFKEVVGIYLDIRNSKTGNFVGLHQIANKLIYGGVSPKLAMEELKTIFSAKRSELSRIAIAYNGGYLSKQSETLRDRENIIADSTKLLTDKKDSDTIKNKRRYVKKEVKKA